MREKPRAAIARRPVTERRIRLPLLVGTLVTLAVLLPGLYFWRAHQVKQGADVFAARAEALAKEESWAESAEYLFLYLRMRPDDANARIQLAETYEHLAGERTRLTRAIELYYQALAAAPPERQQALRQRVGELLMQAQEFVSAEAEARKLIEVDPKDAKAHRLLALALFGQAQSSSESSIAQSGMTVGAALEEAFRLNPTDVQLALTLADVYRNKPRLQSEEARARSDVDRAQLADQCVDELVKADPKGAITHLARYQYRSQNGLPDTESDLDQAVQLEPDNTVVLMVAAQDRLRKLVGRSPASDQARPELLAQAGQFYERAIASSKTLEQAYLGLGEVRWLEGKPDEALQTWESGLTNCGKNSILLNLRMAAALIPQGEFVRAEQCLAALRSAAATLRQRGVLESDLGFTRNAEVLEARIALAKQEQDKAIEILRRVSNDPVSRRGNNPPGYEALMILGEIYAAQGQQDLATKAFDDAALVSPNSAEPRLAAAAMWMNVDRPKLAEDELRKAGKIEDSFENRVLLAGAAIRNQFNLPLKQRDWNSVEKLLNGAKEAVSQTPDTDSWKLSLLEAEFRLRQAEDRGDGAGGIKTALQILQDATETGQHSAEAWSRFANMFERLGDQSAADSALETLRKMFPDQAVAYINSAMILATRKQFPAARRILEEGLQKVAEDQRLPIQLGFVSLDVQEGRAEEAWNALSELQRQDPSNRTLLERALDLALDQKRFQDAETLEQSLSKLPGVKASEWQIYRANRLLLQATGPQDERLTEAEKIATEICQEQRNNSGGQLLLGDVLDREGEPAKAVEAYQKAIQLGEQRLVAYERLMLLLYRLQRFDEANKYLDELSSRTAASTGLSTLEISMAMQSGQPGRALEAARLGAARRPSDPLAQIWVSQLLLAAGKTAEAENALRRAIELGPTDPRTYGAAVNYFVRTKQLDRARAAVEQCARKVEVPPAEREMILAAGYQAIGDHDQALVHFQQAEQLDAQNAGIPEEIGKILLTDDPPVAEKALRRALELNPRSDNARRMLAELLARRGGEERWREAVQMLDRSSDGNKPEKSDRHLEAALLAQRGGPENLARSQQILEELLADSDPMASRSDRLMLALVREAQGNRELARKEYLELTNTASPRPGDVAAYVDFLLRHDEKEEAGRWLDKLEQLNANSVATLGLRVRWLHAENRDSEIEPLLEKTAERMLQPTERDGQPAASQKLQVCQTIGDLYFAARSFKGAERWYRRAFQLDPQQYGRLARSLAELGRIDEAIELCIQSAAQDPSQLPATSVVAVLLRGRPNSDNAERAEALISQSLKEHSDNVDLLTAVAALRVVQQRLDDASVLYQKVLEVQPQNADALNNLATVLAEQPGRASEAITYIDRAIELVGAQPNLLDTKGTILLTLGQEEEAVKLLNAATSAPNSDPRYYLHLAVGRFRVGDVDKAREALEFANKHELSRQVLTQSDTQMLAELNENVR